MHTVYWGLLWFLHISELYLVLQNQYMYSQNKKKAYK